MKTPQKRNKKYDPEKRYGKLTREQYLMKPWQHLIPIKEESESEELAAEEVTA